MQRRSSSVRRNTWRTWLVQTSPFSARLRAFQSRPLSGRGCASMDRWFTCLVSDVHYLDSALCGFHCFRYRITQRFSSLLWILNCGLQRVCIGRLRLCICLPSCQKMLLIFWWLICGFSSCHTVHSATIDINYEPSVLFLFGQSWWMSQNHAVTSAVSLTSRTPIVVVYCVNNINNNNNTTENTTNVQLLYLERLCCDDIASRQQLSNQ